MLANSTLENTVFLDLETWPIARARLAPKPVCMSWVETGRGPQLDLIHACRDRVRTWLKASRLVGQNVAFDMACLAEQWPDLVPEIWRAYDEGRVESVDLNQKLADIAHTGSLDTRGYSLDSLASRYGLPCADKTGPWRMEYASLARVPPDLWPEGAREYVLGDAALPAAIWARQAKQALAGFEARKAWVLHLIACWGVRTDPVQTGRLARYLDRYQAKLKSRLIKHGLVRPDGTRNVRAAEARAVRAGVMSLTNGGKPSLDKETCDSSGDPALRLYSAYSQASTLRARVRDLEQGVDLPLQTRFSSLLETGRTSSSKPGPPLVGAQLQNFPRKAGARECLIPRPGHVFVSADLPSAELRSLAQVCLDKFGRSVMADQLNAGRDLHLWFGGQILGMEYEQVLALAHEPRIKLARQNAKPCNFGFPGGMGAVKFVLYAWLSYRVRLTEQEAKRLKRVWLAAFPEMAEFFAWIDSLLAGRDYATVTHLRSGRVRGRVPYCAACNTQFQELTGNAASSGLYAVSRACYVQESSPLYLSRPVMYTHDEIVCETPEEIAHEAALELSKLMADEFTQWHPDVPALACTGPSKDPRQVVPCVSRRYSKDMKPVWQEGRLVPWEWKQAA